jgi:integrase
MSLRLVKRPKSPNWVIRGTVRGIRLEETTGVADKKAAEEIRAAREAEILKESIYGKQATATFASAALSYVENGGSDEFLKPVADHFGTTPLARIDQHALDAGAKKVYPNVSPSTRNRQFYTPVSAVLHHAARQGWCSKPIIQRPKQPKGRIRWLELVEAEKLLAACSPHLRPLVTFLLYTGARMSEALYLDWTNVDLQRCHVQFLETKNGEARGVPLHPRVVAALASFKHRDGAVFRRPGTKRQPIGDVYAPKDDGGGQIKTAFSGACRRAGISDFHPHDCRHTWATWHYRANRDLGSLQKLGGWKTLAMVMRYAHTNVEEHAHTINKLPGAPVGEIQGSNVAENSKSA